MRAYRESFPLEGGGRGLTQEELLRRMARVDDQYARRFSHTTVSRWESGATRPNRERLEIFGRALNLSPAEVDGLISLAGLGPGQEHEPPDGALDPDAASGGSPETETTELDQAAGAGFAPGAANRRLSRVGMLATHCIVAAVLPGIAIVGVAYLLSFVGWNDLWMPFVYIGVVVALRLSAGFLRLGTPYDVCEFVCVSIFVLLTTPMLQSAVLQMDHYGFCSIEGFAGTAKPYMYALLVNLAVSSAAGFLFYSLWKWQYGRGRLAGNPVRRAVLVVLPPMGLVFATMAVITNVGILLQLGVVFAVFSTVCIILLLLRDSTVVPREGDRRFVLSAVLLVGTVMTTIGVATSLAILLTPNLAAVFPDQNILYSWTVDYMSMGYTREEALARFNMGYLWHAASVFVYMVFVVGGYLITSVYSWDRNVSPESPREPACASLNISTGPPAILRQLRSWFNLR